MIANLIGMTPEEMKGYVNDAVELLNALNSRLARIERQLGIEYIVDSDGNTVASSKEYFEQIINRIDGLNDEMATYFNVTDKVKDNAEKIDTEQSIGAVAE